MAFEIGQQVRTPDGVTARVLAITEDLVTVQLDGEATGTYEPTQLQLVADHQEA
jgi:preprotein translocase subunit YajC